jgi:predicted nucleotidyltransferase
MMNKKLDKIKPKVVLILKKNGVKKAGFFGSFVRSEQKKGSDIDLLVEFKEGKSLLDLIGLEQYLNQEFNEKFDLITYASLHPLLKNRILSEEERIL